MKKLFRLTITYDDIACIDRFFESYTLAYKFAMAYLDDIIETNHHELDRYECIIVETEGVVL